MTDIIFSVFAFSNEQIYHENDCLAIKESFSREHCRVNKYIEMQMIIIIGGRKQKRRDLKRTNRQGFTFVPREASAGALGIMLIFWGGDERMGK